MAIVNNLETQLSSLSINPDDNIFDRLRNTKATSKKDKLKYCLDHFDDDKDGCLNIEEFSHLVKDLFCNKGKSYDLSKQKIGEIFKLLDTNQDGKIDDAEFDIVWHHWLKQVVDPVSALIVVDVQNDFISGTMSIKDCPAGQDGIAVVPVINKMLDDADFDMVVYSLDWHPANHISFIENVANRKLHNSSKVSAEQAVKMDTVVFEGPPFTEQKMWPSHCVQNSWGSQLHKDLQIVKGSLQIYKGTNPEIDSYSAFWDNRKLSQTSLVSELTKAGVTDVYVCGLAYDVCVGSTALHALEHGFRTVLVHDASLGVTLPDIEAMQSNIIQRNGILVDSDRVPAMVSAEDRRPELGYLTALNVARAQKIIGHS